jgi:outer membrane cobalamin receptor
VSWRGRGPLSATARLYAVGIRHDRDFGFPVTAVVLPSYERLDLSAEYRLPARGMTQALSLRVENATNAHYENVFNFLTPRRTVSLGLRSQW